MYGSAARGCGRVPDISRIRDVLVMQREAFPRSSGKTWANRSNPEATTASTQSGTQRMQMLVFVDQKWGFYSPCSSQSAHRARFPTPPTAQLRGRCSVVLLVTLPETQRLQCSSELAANHCRSNCAWSGRCRARNFKSPSGCVRRCRSTLPKMPNGPDLGGAMFCDIMRTAIEKIKHSWSK